LIAHARVAVVAIAAIACGPLALPATQAAGQEAPICLKGKEKLDDGPNNWHGTGHHDSVTGLRGKDHMDGRGGNDLINGGRDNDVVKGGDGDDVLCGGRGSDKLIGGPGDDRIFGEEENDTVIPGPGDDEVLGSAGNDRLYGWGKSHGEIVDDGIDILDGGFNDDIVEAGGADTLLGFTHDDILRTKTPEVAPKLMDGGGNDDRLFGSDADDRMRGSENHDKLKGRGGDDRLLGGGGRDILNGGPGEDSCDGGKLDDRAKDCEHRHSIPRPLARVRFPFGSP
jgi:Ca2+-binding RTX toxin-like protein